MLTGIDEEDFFWGECMAIGEEPHGGQVLSQEDTSICRGCKLAQDVKPACMHVLGTQSSATRVRIQVPLTAAYAGKQPGKNHFGTGESGMQAEPLTSCQIACKAA